MKDVASFAFVNCRDPEFANPLVDIAASSRIGVLFGKLGLGCSLTDIFDLVLAD